jgi:hypothetical protein
VQIKNKKDKSKISAFVFFLFATQKGDTADPLV